MCIDPTILTYRNITVIIPDKKTIKKLEDLDSKNDYKDAADIIRSYIIFGLFDTAEDFQKPPTIRNIRSRRLMIKSVKPPVVEVENGTLTKAKDYEPDRTEGPGSRPNMTAVWVIDGEINIDTEVLLEEKRKSKRGGFFDNPDTRDYKNYKSALIKQVLNTFDRRHTIIVTVLVRIIKYFEEHATALYDTAQFFMTGIPEVDLMLILYCEELFPTTQLVKAYIECGRFLEYDSNPWKAYMAIHNVNNATTEKRHMVANAISKLTDNVKTYELIDSIEKLYEELQETNSWDGITGVMPDAVYNIVKPNKILLFIHEVMFLFSRVTMNGYLDAERLRTIISYLSDKDKTSPLYKKYNIAMNDALGCQTLIRYLVSFGHYHPIRILEESELISYMGAIKDFNMKLLTPSE
jgi:hypothetical protein